MTFRDSSVDDSPWTITVIASLRSSRNIWSLGLLCLSTAIFIGCGSFGLTEHLDEQEFKQLIQDSDVVLVKFGASYCGPCNRLDEELDTVAHELPDNIKIVRIKASQNPELCRKFGVEKIPRMLLYRDGYQVGDKVGCMNDVHIRNWIGISGGATAKGKMQSNPFAT